MHPLSGYRVIGFTQSVSGPTCTQQLAYLGADIIKVEPPWGDTGRDQVGGAQFASFNKGAKCLCIDLKTDEGRSIARSLTADADIIVENFRPGVMDRLGLGYDDVTDRNPGVIYCSISGFGETGPYRDHAAYDPIIQSMSGLMSVTGEPDMPPVRIGTSALDWTTGMTAAFTILGGILHKNRTGEGLHIDVSLFDIAISWLAYWIGLYSETGEVKKNVGNVIFDNTPYGLYYAANEEPFFLCAGNTQMQFERLCRSIDREDLIDDSRFGSRPDRWKHRETLRAELHKTFIEYNCQKLVDQLIEDGVAAGTIQDIDDIVDRDPHVKERALLTETYNPTSNRSLQTVGPAYRLNGSIPNVQELPHNLGADAKEVLQMYGYSEDELNRLFEAGVLHKSD